MGWSGPAGSAAARGDTGCAWAAAGACEWPAWAWAGYALAGAGLDC